MRKFDIIIAGAGPAGASAAARLAELGYEVALLDKARFPRAKPCGGGLTEKSMALLPESARACVEDKCDTVELTLRMEKRFVHEAGRPLVFTVSRERLDQALVLDAKEKGALLFEREKVKAVCAEKERVKVITETKEFGAKLLLVACGGGRPSGIFKWGPKPARAKAVVVETEADPETMERFRGRVIFDFLEAERGYGWVFPKKNRLNMGLYTLDSAHQGLASMLKSYIRKRLGIRQDEERLFSSLRAGFIPLGGHKGPFHAERMMFLGDAAGLADPFIGEGIYFALKSARLAAEAADRALKNQAAASAGYYSELVARELGKHILISWTGTRLFHLTPSLYFQLLASPRYRAAGRRGFEQYLQEGRISPLQVFRTLLAGQGA